MDKMKLARLIKELNMEYYNTPAGTREQDLIGDAYVALWALYYFKFDVDKAAVNSTLTKSPA